MWITHLGRNVEPELWVVLNLLIAEPDHTDPAWKGQQGYVDYPSCSAFNDQVGWDALVDTSHGSNSRGINSLVTNKKGRVALYMYEAAP